MHQKKGKKILIYFILFLIVGSINNSALTKFQFEKIKNIQISGLYQNQNLNTLDQAKNQYSNYILLSLHLRYSQNLQKLIL